MNTASFPIDEVRALADAACDGTITSRDAERLEAILAENADARRFYLTCIRLDGCLRWEFGQDGGQKAEGGEEMGGQWPVACGQSTTNLQTSKPPNLQILPPLTIPSIVIDTTPSLHSPLGSFLFSHLAAAVILGIGLLIGLAWRVSLPSPEGPAPDTRSLAQAVGRITALADCQWSKQGAEVRDQGSGIPKTQDRRPKTVYLDDRFIIASGLMQITYDSGAKVILEGPCTYEIDSDRGGFLAVGRLTARVASEPKSQIQRPKPQDPRPLFAVRTPMAVVTDLGTEFGVAVDESGTSWTRVFHGRVELRLLDDNHVDPSSGRVSKGHGNGHAIQLGANESATVEVRRGGSVRVVRNSSQSNMPVFIRHMPKPLPSMIISTGVGLKEGDPDPHWQVVARSDDPNFQPRPAVVAVVGSDVMPNDPARSQWISISKVPPSLPAGITFTFRATFKPRDDTPQAKRLPIIQFWCHGSGGMGKVRAVGCALASEGKPAVQDAYDPESADGVSYVEYTLTTGDSAHMPGRNTLMLRVEVTPGGKVQ